MLGKIYHHLGVLSKGEVITVDRSRLVGRFIGDTEENVKNLLKEARGNVLFIDEAYTLYGPEGSDIKTAYEQFAPHPLELKPRLRVVGFGS